MAPPFSPSHNRAESIANGATSSEIVSMLSSDQSRASLDVLNDLPTENRLTGNDGPAEKRSTVDTRSWPQQPSLLKESTIWGRLALIWQVVVILLPSIFLGKYSPQLHSGTNAITPTWHVVTAISLSLTDFCSPWDRSLTLRWHTTVQIRR